MPVAMKIIKVAIKVITVAVLIVLRCLLWLLHMIADSIAEQNIPYWDFIEAVVSIFPWLFLLPATVAMYVLAIVEAIHHEHSRPAVTAIAGTCFLGWWMILLILRRVQRQAERSLRDKIALLPPGVRELYDEIAVAPGIKPEEKDAAKALVTIPSKIKCGQITREAAESFIGEHKQDSDDQMKLLAGVIGYLIDQEPPAAPVKPQYITKYATVQSRDTSGDKDDVRDRREALKQMIRSEGMARNYICQDCGAKVSGQNLVRHFDKVHPKGSFRAN